MSGQDPLKSNLPLKHVLCRGQLWLCIYASLYCNFNDLLIFKLIRDVQRILDAMRCCSVSFCTNHHVFTLRPCSQLDSRKTLCPRTGYPCHISQLYGMVYRVSGLDVRARFVFDWQYISALRFPSALISPASRYYERLISFFTPCSSRTLYVTLTPGCYCSVRPCQERRSRTGLCPTPARSTLSGLS